VHKSVAPYLVLDTTAATVIQKISSVDDYGTVRVHVAYLTIKQVHVLIGDSCIRVCIYIYAPFNRSFHAYMSETDI
jgi:hypothetical protein